MNTDDQEGPRWRLTSRLADKKGQRRLFEKLDVARDLFPELKGRTITVGVSARAAGLACTERWSIWFKSRNVSYYVIGHELTHLLQGGRGVPEGERSCDVYTLARSDMFCDQAPYYLTLPASVITHTGWVRVGRRYMLHHLAKEAVAERERGRKNYIKWFEAEVKRFADKLD
jgi:hypothetical protein